MKKLLLLFFVLPELFSACKKPNVIAPLSNLVPYMKAGNSWTYVIVSDSLPYKTCSMWLTGATGDSYEMDTRYDDEEAPAAYIYYTNGGLNHYFKGQSRASRQMYLKYENVAVGDTWSSVSDNMINRFEVLSLTDTVVVPAGTFVCKRIENLSLPETNWYSDQVGLIKRKNTWETLELNNKNF